MYFIESIYSIKGIYKFVIPLVSVSFNTKFTVGFAGFPFGFRLLSESVQVACGKWRSGDCVGRNYSVWYELPTSTKKLQ